MRIYLWLGGGVLAAAAVLLKLGWGPGSIPHVATWHNSAAEAPSICPWRDPPNDLARFFGPSVSYSTEILVLSRARAWIVKAVGPTPEPLANVLYVRRVFRSGRVVGSILTGRAPGQFGVIEVVVAVDPGRRIIGVRIQRSREIGAAGRLIASERWLRAFRGKSARDAFRPGEDLPAVAPDVRPTAQAVAQEVRALVIELEAASRFHTGQLRGGV